MNTNSKSSAIHTLLRRGSDLALSVVGCNYALITVDLRGVEVDGIRERVFHHGPLNSYLKISVDGDVVLTTDVAHSSLHPRWDFPAPHKLRVRASSVVKFSLYRQHNILHMLDDEKLGEFEARLISILNNDTQYRLSSRTSPISTIRVELAVDQSTTLEDAEIVYAKHQVEKLWQQPCVHAVHERGSRITDFLTQAIRYLDHCVDFLNDVSELHPWIKTAWIFLLSVYKRIKLMDELDTDIRRLVIELRDTLAQVQVCRLASSIPGANKTMDSVLRLVVECAALIDEWLHMSSLKKPFKASSLSRRIKDCADKLVDLRNLMSVFIGAQHITEAIINGVGEVKQLLSQLQVYAVHPVARPTDNMRCPLPVVAAEEADLSKKIPETRTPTSLPSSKRAVAICVDLPAYSSTPDLLASSGEHKLSQPRLDGKVPFPTVTHDEHDHPGMSTQNNAWSKVRTQGPQLPHQAWQ